MYPKERQFDTSVMCQDVTRQGKRFRCSRSSSILHLTTVTSSGMPSVFYYGPCFYRHSPASKLFTFTALELRRSPNHANYRCKNCGHSFYLLCMTMSCFCRQYGGENECVSLKADWNRERAREDVAFFWYAVQHAVPVLVEKAANPGCKTLPTPQTKAEGPYQTSYVPPSTYALREQFYGSSSAINGYQHHLWHLALPQSPFTTIQESSAPYMGQFSNTMSSERQPNPTANVLAPKQKERRPRTILLETVPPYSVLRSVFR
uniref:Nuclear receptor domain-containing protein n=1 Tax=Angiostrongylus cantonensis TaxID=6313 RepID=A0A0K0DAY2_ANGCA